MNLYDVVKQPIISEKTTQSRLEAQIYTFYVDVKASKHQVKKAVEKIWQVEVLRVNTSILRTNPKKKVYFHKPKIKHLKKAMVKLKEGNVIDVFDM